MFWNKKEKPWIKFTADEHVRSVIPEPVTARRAIPDWFKKIKPSVEGADRAAVGTIKRCKPVLDACSQGYIIPLWADLQVKVTSSWQLIGEDGQVLHELPPMGPNKKDFIGKTIDDLPGQPAICDIKDGELEVYFAFPEFVGEALKQSDPLSLHSWEQVGNACDLKKFSFGKKLTKLNNPWVIETPPGWSVQIKNPANNWSNDIQLIEGVVDTDEYHTQVLFPFVWTGSEKGEWIIPKGTPIAQVIPFRREEVELKIDNIDEYKRDKIQHLLNTMHIDRYANMFWHKRRT
ncbi:MAG: DUF6065 family protein [Chloroflexi bacterium]|nr:DUF6065 family protein [Chloroflexota bacterium]